MSYHKKFPIYNDTMSLVLLIEKIVSTFPRYHKYALGTKIRTDAYDILDAITFSLNNKESRIQSIQKAHNISETLKNKISLAKDTLSLFFSYLGHIQHAKSYTINTNQIYYIKEEFALKQRKLRYIFISNHIHHNTKEYIC